MESDAVLRVYGVRIEQDSHLVLEKCLDIWGNLAPSPPPPIDAGIGTRILLMT